MRIERVRTRGREEEGMEGGYEGESEIVCVRDEVGGESVDMHWVT